MAIDIDRFGNPQERFCRGSINLGTGCRKCPRCISALKERIKPRNRCEHGLINGKCDQCEINKLNGVIDNLTNWLNEFHDKDSHHLSANQIIKKIEELEKLQDF